jgi:hypothetical protein
MLGPLAPVPSVDAAVAVMAYNDGVMEKRIKYYEKTCPYCLNALHKDAGLMDFFVISV